MKGYSEKMSRRVSLPDFLGKEDSDINAIFSDETDENNRFATVKRILLKVIENELTERQKQIINLYYFKNMNIAELVKVYFFLPKVYTIILKTTQ